MGDRLGIPGDVGLFYFLFFRTNIISTCVKSVLFDGARFCGQRNIVRKKRFQALVLRCQSIGIKDIVHHRRRLAPGSAFVRIESNRLEVHWSFARHVS